MKRYDCEEDKPGMYVSTAGDWVKHSDLTALVESHGRLIRSIEHAYPDAATHVRGEDCYSTGPKTGDVIMDHIECPGCALRQALDSARRCQQ